MLLIRKRAFARAGLVGNPSDGYHGRTISISVRNFWAEVVLYEWDSVDIVLLEDDRASFRSVKDLARDVRLHGYYGGIRLVKATIKRFVEYCEARHVALHDRNFSIRYETTVPRQVGLAGSSAIIVATLRCLMEFYDVTIPLANVQDHQIRIQGSATYLPEDYAESIRLLQAGAVRAADIVTATRSMEEVAEAFDLSASGHHIKVLVTIT